MTYLVFDTESCTGRSDDGSLCSVGVAVCDENFDVLRREDVLINPIPKRFTVGDKRNAKRTGITFAYTVEQFRKAPKFSEVYSKIADYFKVGLVLGFSMANDVKYLNDACDKYGLERIEYEYLDIQFVYQLLSGDMASVGLKKLADKYEISYTEHRADDDAAVSIALLKRILEEYDVTLEEVVKKYGVHYGKNTSEGHYNNYSDAVSNELFGLKRSRKLQAEVFYEYLSSLPKKGGKRICFSSKIERMDVNYVRTLIDLLRARGYVYTNNADTCSVFVSSEDKDVRENIVDKIKRRKVVKITLAELERLVGYSENFKYDDAPLLRKYYEALLPC